jgi:hypothetical protein
LCQLTRQVVRQAERGRPGAGAPALVPARLPLAGGIEGRIGVLQRQYGLARCPDHGADGAERWVGWGVLTANLVTIARATAG